MPRYKVVATQDWSFGDCHVKAGQVVGYIETDMAPWLLLDGERSGRLQIQAIEEPKPEAPPAAEPVAAATTTEPAPVSEPAPEPEPTPVAAAPTPAPATPKTPRMPTL